MRILIIEDDALVADGMRRGLSQSGFAVDHVASAELAEAALTQENFDLLLVDLGLPGADGFDLVRRLRRGGNSAPVLIVTARDALADRVSALDLGADDYLVKPFALPELLARIRALLRRGRPSEVFRLKAGDLELDLVMRRALRGERLLDLTPREFELLEYLLHHQGHLVSREMLAREVWKEPRRATPLDNVIDVQMTRLRKKVDSEGGTRLIHTVRGVGFVLKEGEP
jgi:DNA-binding response OmpR family regulator